MWTSRTTSAPWGGRIGHTTVIDAAGAIYVIGGFASHNGTDSFFNDVWVSTDRGAGRTRAGGMGCTRRWSGGLAEYQGGTKGYYRCTEEVLGRY